jgi:hypothetical protein
VAEKLQARKPRLLALMQPSRPRLGACSPLRALDQALLQIIVRALHPPIGPDRDRPAAGIAADAADTATENDLDPDDRVPG